MGPLRGMVLSEGYSPAASLVWVREVGGRGRRGMTHSERYSIASLGTVHLSEGRCHLPTYLRLHADGPWMALARLQLH